MARKKSGFDYGDEPTAEQQEAVMPDVPEGMDEAIYKQGWDEAIKNAAVPDAQPLENRFAPDTPQAEAWQAGYDAGVAAAPAPEPPPE
jgi:hypothetical protein